VLDRQMLTLTLPSPAALLKMLRLSGSHVMSPARGLMTPSKLEAFYQEYQAYRTQEGTYEATFELVVGQCWGRAPARMTFKPRSA
jgi:hypothetical protein